VVAVLIFQHCTGKVNTENAVIPNATRDLLFKKQIPRGAQDDNQLLG